MLLSRNVVKGTRNSHPKIYRNLSLSQSHNHFLDDHTFVEDVTIICNECTFFSHSWYHSLQYNKCKVETLI